MASSIEDARSLIGKRLAELDAERRRLTAALAALDGSAAARGDGAAKPRRNARRRAKRASPGQRQAEFLALLESHPEASMSELAREMGVRPQQLYPIARRLTGEGAIAKGDDGHFVRTAPAGA